MTTQHGTAPVSETTRTAVTVHGLRKPFGDVIAGDGIDLEVAPGEVVALLGPNGAGKTTAIEMLLGRTVPSMRNSSLWPNSAAGSGRRPHRALGAVGLDEARDDGC